MSFFRSVIRRFPRSSSTPMSPVCSQPSGSIASAVASGIVDEALHERCSAHHDLARFARGDGLAIVVDGTHLGYRESRDRSLRVGFGRSSRYGLTDARYRDDVSSTTTTGDDLEDCGRAIPVPRCVPSTHDGKARRRGRTGEVVVRGYNVNERASSTIRRPPRRRSTRRLAAHGRHRRARRSGETCVSPTGKKDMFIVGGFNAYPAEIEGMMLEHPGVSQVAIVGVPDTRMGEVGYAYVVPRHGAELDVDELTAWCRDHMPTTRSAARSRFVMRCRPTRAARCLKYELRIGRCGQED